MTRKRHTDVQNHTSVGILTVTRNRPEALLHAIRSVCAQECGAVLTHLVVVDDCDATCQSLTALVAPPQHLCWRFLPRGPEDVTGPRRCAQCLNCGVRMLDTDWIAFLDDDNEFEPSHIASLLETAQQSGCRAIHSYMKMYHANGHPFIDERNPWCGDQDEAASEFRWMVARGVRSPGSNVVRDSIDPDDHSPVDLGEWLLRRDLLDEIPFQTEYSDNDLEIGRHEDDVFLETLIERAEPVACTGKATFRYYLGGYSTCNGGYANPYGTSHDE